MNKKIAIPMENGLLCSHFGHCEVFAIVEVIDNKIVNIIEDEKYESNQGIYHFSNEGVCSWYDFAVVIQDLFGNRCNIQPCHSDEFPSKVKRPHFSVLDKTKIKQTFDLTIPHWKNSLQNCVELLKK